MKILHLMTALLLFLLILYPIKVKRLFLVKILLCSIAYTSSHMRICSLSTPSFLSLLVLLIIIICIISAVISYHSSSLNSAYSTPTTYLTYLWSPHLDHEALDHSLYDRAVDRAVVTQQLYNTSCMKYAMHDSQYCRQYMN